MTDNTRERLQRAAERLKDANLSDLTEKELNAYVEYVVSDQFAEMRRTSAVHAAILPRPVLAAKAEAVLRNDPNYLRAPNIEHDTRAFNHLARTVLQLEYVFITIATIGGLEAAISLFSRIVSKAVDGHYERFFGDSFNDIVNLVFADDPPDTLPEEE